MDVGHVTASGGGVGGVDGVVENGWIPILVTGHDDVWQRLKLTISVGLDA